MPAPDPEDNVDDSESEDEAVNGTLVMFPGTEIDSKIDR